MQKSFASFNSHNVFGGTTMWTLLLGFIMFIGMGYCAIFGVINTIGAIFGPAEVIPTFLGYAMGFVICMIGFVGFTFFSKH